MSDKTQDILLLKTLIDSRSGKSNSTELLSLLIFFAMFLIFIYVVQNPQIQSFQNPQIQSFQNPQIQSFQNPQIHNLHKMQSFQNPKLISFEDYFMSTYIPCPN